MSVCHIAILWAALECVTPALRADDLSFSRDIRPILSNHCGSCHGADEAARQGGLRLDVRDNALAPLESGKTAIVPLRPDASELIARIESPEADMVMPPPDAKKPLSLPQKQLLRRWIELGAEYSPHWAFISPKRPATPAVQRVDWPRNPIDAFVLTRLEAAGLAPSPEAARETLVRRLSLDLTGLPPSPDESAAFLRDESPDAYDRLVDRLLASPRFGERLAQVWLDVARYADTNGYNNDEERVMWRWRDWVIAAFNGNVPYDQFVVEQLAGDLLPNPSLDQRLATGFHRNHVLTTEGGIIDEEYRVEYVADRVQTTGSVFLGLTLQCARCHDHKFDPIAQREYYRLFAFFNNSPDKLLGYNQGAPATPFLKAPTADQQAALDDLGRKRAAAQERLAQRETEIDAPLVDWERALAPDDPARSAPLGLALYFPFDEPAGAETVDPLDPARRGTVSGKADWVEGKQGRALAFDGQTYVEAGQAAAFDRQDRATIAAWVYRSSDAPLTVLSKMHDTNAFRGYDLILEAGKPAMHLIHQWPENGLKVVGQSVLPLNEWKHLCVTYDGSSRAVGAKLYVDGQPQPLDVAADALSGTIATDRPFHVGRRADGSPFQGRIDDVRFYRTVLSPEDVARLARGEAVSSLAAVLDVPVGQRNAEQQALLRRYFFETVDAQAKQFRVELAALGDRLAEMERAVPTALVMEDLATPRIAHVLERGQYDKPGAEVTPGTPASLPPLAGNLPPGQAPNRLDLARWLVAPEHPLTARVAVNRWWAMLFGVGLVETEEDFGVQGALPSHPELLDWLARQYSRPHGAGGGLGWDTKALLRLIVTSATYRQSSDVSAEIHVRDPHNRLLARGPRFRLSAEQVRDNALAAAGMLVERWGGPSVKPYQPEGLWEDVSVERRYKYEPARGEGLYRRSLYTYWKRTCPPPGMTAFDAPDREFCVIRRARTNTPLQALVLLNDATYVEAARCLAQRALREGSDFDARLEALMQRVLSRSPRPLERQVLADVERAALARFASHPDDASKLLAVGESPRDPSLDSTQLAAWTAVASVVLNLDESLTKE